MSADFAVPLFWYEIYRNLFRCFRSEPFKTSGLPRLKGTPPLVAALVSSCALRSVPRAEGSGAGLRLPSRPETPEPIEVVKGGVHVTSPWGEGGAEGRGGWTGTHVGKRIQKVAVKRRRHHLWSKGEDSFFYGFLG